MMRTWNNLPDWLDRRRALAVRTVGFVPTMGALHRGHASLVARCRAENQVAVASIFVNPTQFNDPADLDRYPRTLDRDLALLESLGVDEVLLPGASELYPRGYRFRVEPGCDSHIMEGAHRPGFLAGVMTVVLKLLNIVRPDRAYFGEKDYQQLKTIQDMVADFFIPVEIVPCATVRADSGLAESSRNALLSPDARSQASALFHVLAGARNANEAKDALASEGFCVEYVEEHWGRRFAAASLDGVRLIDNIPIPAPGEPCS
jgi:pantoate--beta-alanine ligase